MTTLEAIHLLLHNSNRIITMTTLEAIHLLLHNYFAIKTNNILTICY